MKMFLFVAASLAAIAAPAAADDLRAAIDADYAHVEALYKHLHANPELSFKEKETSKRLAAELEALGFDVTSGVGAEWTKKKAMADAGAVLPGVDGYGVVAVMRNGVGPTVLLRADMDALPLEEKTGVAYASKATGADYLGTEAPVMHACGHDVHMAAWVGAARRLVAMKGEWSGTLVMIAQPAEELGLGALAMIDDGLFEKYPRPDYNVALHVNGADPAGSVTYTKGFALANVDTVDITVRGVGGHGAAPHLAKDPVVIAAQIVTALQTLVSREVNPLESGVVTVGSLTAGFKHNIIPDEAHLKITIRSYKDEVRKTLVEGVARIAKAQALSAGLPENLAPIVAVETDALVATYNDPALTERVLEVFTERFGTERVYAIPPTMGGEDFAYFGRTEPKIPSFIFWIGGADPMAVANAKAGAGPTPPSNHSPFFAPVPAPTLKTGVEALSAAALELFGAEDRP